MFSRRIDSLVAAHSDTRRDIPLDDTLFPLPILETGRGQLLQISYLVPDGAKPTCAFTTTVHISSKEIFAHFRGISSYTSKGISLTVALSKFNIISLGQKVHGNHCPKRKSLRLIQMLLTHIIYQPDH